MDGTITQACQDAIEAQFSEGASKVALRGRTGMGLSSVVVGLVAARAAEGAVLILAPTVTHTQIKADLARVDPDLGVGDFGSGARVELVNSFRASIYRDRHPVDAFSLIVAEECWPNEAQRLRDVVGALSAAQTVEVVRMPPPHVPNLACDAEVDVEDVIASMTAPTP